jgi:hypothetical protein
VQKSPGSERLPVRVEPRLKALIGIVSADAEVCVADQDAMPSLRVFLSQPQAMAVTLLASVHSNAGIPLSSAVCQVEPGDTMLHTPPLGPLAMEGYAHLKPEARLGVLRRVWSRRAYVALTLP